MLHDYEALQSAQELEKLSDYERQLDQHTDEQRSYIGLEKQSLRVQRKVSSILKAMVFDQSSSESNVLAAVLHFQNTDGQLGKSPPLDFLTSKEQALFDDDQPFRTSLYKILLFRAVATAVRAGKLNLCYSYRYRAIQDYLIPMSRWAAERERLLTMSNLVPFADGAACLASLKLSLEVSYKNVNDRYHSGDNEH